MLDEDLGRLNMSQNKVFKVGTIFSFQDFDDQYEVIGMVVAIQQKGIGFSYSIYDTETKKEFWVNGSNLNRAIEKEYWKIEYEPE